MSWSEIASQLTRDFGLGTNPVARRRLYFRLQREVQKFGDPVHEIISMVAMESRDKTCPAHWFARSVVLRLKDAGFLTDGEDKVKVNPREVAASIAAKTAVL